MSQVVESSEPVIINLEQLNNAFNGIVANTPNSTNQDSTGVPTMTVPTLNFSNTSFMLPIVVNRSINAGLMESVYSACNKNGQILQIQVENPQLTDSVANNNTNTVSMINNSTAILAGQDGSVNKTSAPSKPQAPSDSYYCLECKRVFNGACPNHLEPVVIVEDAPILSRARITIPENLYLKDSLISPSLLGVWTRKPLSKMTRFGPLYGEICIKENLPKQNEPLTTWSIFQDDKLSYGICVQKENECNWMMFMRSARNQLEQNLVAYQDESQIFFITNKAVDADKELSLWYSPDYAKLIGAAIKPEDSCRCPHCQKLFCDIPALNGHMKYSHPDMSSRKWRCATCTRAFPSATKYNIHLLSHMGVKPHKCNYCTKEFTDQSNLRMHLSIHTGEKKYQCDTCQRLFRQKAHLKSHHLTHTGEKKLKCQYCEKFFARASDVKQHEYQHTHEREYKCDTCNKKFFKLQNFKKHIKIHTGLRDFLCQKCPKSFYTKYHLQRHLKSCKEIKVIYSIPKIVNENINSESRDKKKRLDKNVENNNDKLNIWKGHL